MLKYFKLGFYFLKEVFYYSYIILFENVHLLFLILVLATLGIFGASMKGLDNIGGISLSVYVWYIFITELVMTNRRDNNLINEIKSGSIVTLLNKPINFIGFYLSNTFFKTLIKMLIIGTFCGLVIFAFAHTFPRFGILKFILFFISILCGVGLISLFNLIMGLAAFAMEDSSFIRLLINKFYFIFGGLFFPIDIYPTWLQNITKFFPFQYFLYAPAKFFTTGDLSFFAHYFPIQVLWLVVILGLNMFIYKKMVKRLEINGG